MKNCGLNLKRTKGITLVALIITIVVMVIIAAVSISTGSESVENINLKGLFTNLELIQKRVDEIQTINESYTDSQKVKIYLKEQGEELTEEQKSFLVSICGDSTGYKYFSADDLHSVLGVEYIDINVFINFEKRSVISQKGVKYNNKIYYQLETDTYFVDNKE